MNHEQRKTNKEPQGFDNSPDTHPKPAIIASIDGIMRTVEKNNELVYQLRDRLGSIMDSTEIEENDRKLNEEPYRFSEVEKKLYDIQTDVFLSNQLLEEMKERLRI